MILALLLACETPQSPPTPAAPADPVVLVELDAPRLLRRISLDLRGVLPSVEELDWVEADPAALDAIRDTYLEDARFEERLVAMFTEIWYTRTASYPIPAWDYGVSEEDTYVYLRSIGEEPLRLMAYVAVNDLPWTEIVTADYTLANEMLASLWPIDYPDEASGWAVSTYTDGRPGAGVLSTNGLWWRYVTSVSNKNRSRAAQLSRLLLCEDYLERPITFSRRAGLSDDDASQATLTEEGCVSCHSSLDPMSAALFGFYTGVDYNAQELEVYHPEREALGPYILGVEPAWFGTPIEGLEELSGQLAVDRRFLACAAQSAAQMLWRRPTAADDFDTVEALRQSLIAGDLRYPALVRAVTDTPQYRVGSVSGGTEAEQEAVLTRRLMTPDQLASVMEDVTRFKWENGGYDLMRYGGGRGYLVLGGGVDGEEVTNPQQVPGLTWSLVVKRQAEAASITATQLDFLYSMDAPVLFTEVAATDVPGDPAFRSQLETIYWRLFAERPTEETLLALEALWTGVEPSSGSTSAWASVLTVLFRDPAFQAY